MDNKTYQSEAMKVDRGTYEDVTERLQTKGLARLLNAQLGLSGEVGELTDALKKHIMYGKSLDLGNVKEECGDILWYMAILLDEVGSSFDEVMTINDAKLKARFPKGFSEDNANLRLDKELTDE